MIESVQSLLPSTGFVFAFFNWKPRFHQDESEACYPVALKNFLFDCALCLNLFEVYRLQNLVRLELPIKHAQNITHFI